MTEPRARTPFLRAAIVGVATAIGGACGSSGGGDLYSGGGTGGARAGSGGESGAAGAGASGAPGLDASGGGSASGGADSSTDGGAGGAVDAPAGDAGERSCLDGTWAIRVSIQVTWPGTFVLQPGEDELAVWMLGQTTMNALSGSQVLRACGITLPDLQSTLLGVQKFGVRFPDSIFDSGSVPLHVITIDATGLGPGSTFATNNSVLLIGLTMPDPLVPWPASSGSIASADHDNDGKPGVTTTAAGGAGYFNPPVDPTGINRADRIYVVTRTVGTFSGQLVTCGEIEGSVAFATLGGQPAVDSHIVGCRTMFGADCSPTQTGFVDSNQPKFTPVSASVRSVRVAETSTCADVRAILP